MFFEKFAYNGLNMSRERNRNDNLSLFQKRHKKVRNDTVSYDLYMEPLAYLRCSHLNMDPNPNSTFTKIGR